MSADFSFGAADQPSRKLADELSNALAVVIGNLALAERHAAGNPKLIRLLTNMRAAAERGTDLAQQLAASQGRGAGLGFAGFAEDAIGFGEGPSVRRRILVVEDDPAVADIAVAVLEDMGHSVTVRQDAPSALTALYGAERFDLIFSDIVMPGGMSGIELAERVAALHPKLPILLATGYSSAALAPEAMRFPVLSKPYSAQDLSRRVALMLPAK